jgi:hypothetical protein
MQGRGGFPGPGISRPEGLGGWKRAGHEASFSRNGPGGSRRYYFLLECRNKLIDGAMAGVSVACYGVNLANAMVLVFVFWLGVGGVGWRGGCGAGRSFSHNGPGNALVV